MKNLGSHTGYLIIDHSNSPGINIEDVPERLRNKTVIVNEGQVFEADTKNCTHCERGIILNPERVRDRARCPYCHHYICDECEKMLRITGQCVPFKKVVDKAADFLAHHPEDEPLIVLANS